jgi:low affinity Fe/Cu permease
MKGIYHHTERGFEKIASIAIAVLGNSIAFIIAFCVVIFWLSNKMFYTQDIHYSIGDVILGVTFLSLFIIQKSFNRFSASLHIKINELLASHNAARNAMIGVEKKSESELVEISKEYSDLAQQGKTEEGKNAQTR